MHTVSMPSAQEFVHPSISDLRPLLGSQIPDANGAPPTAPELMQSGLQGILQDSHGRIMTDLRLSVTDRCNYRCVYCRTGTEGALYSELPIAEYGRILRLFVSLGIRKIRLTGGEPLLRSGLIDLLRETSALTQTFGLDSPLDIAITTNGHLLAPMAKDLRAAGLTRITVSMDGLDPETFHRMSRVPNGFARVMDGIHSAQDAGLGPVKVNCVLIRGLNDHQIEAFAEFSRREGVIVRFIEFMPLKEDRTWSPDSVVPLDEIVSRLERIQPLRTLSANHQAETARRYTFADGLGEIGIIAPVSHPFCGHCSRMRVTSDGKVRTCLFSQSDHDMVGRMRRGASDDELRVWLQSVVDRKEARHHIGEAGFLQPARSMVHIGG